MVEDPDSLAPEGLPIFLEKTERLKEVLQQMSQQQLQSLWKCNDAITRLNVQRLQDMDLRRRLTPAVLSYQGIQYQYMAPGVLEVDQLHYIQKHLRILSGFYGLLRPFDGVVPYRLEMQARLSTDGCRDLYDYWSNTLAQQLASETNQILNLASKEYSKAVLPHLPDTVHLVTCIFGEMQNGKVVEKGTLCKMARGEMVRWMAEHAVSSLEEVRTFSRLDYCFSPSYSTSENYVFIKGEN